MDNREILAYTKGVHNLLSDEIIPQDAASDSLNWITQDGKILLVPGKVIVGASGVAGNVTGGIFGYKADGTQVHWRKIGTKIQYLNGTTWTDTVTGLTSSADYSFANYASPSGTFTFATGVDGIYKFHNANPGSFCSMYNSTYNFKGKSIIDKGRMLMWDIVGAKTVLRGSKLDTIIATGGTVVTGEATTSLTGTLAFKAGGATRNCFSVQITLTGTGEVYTEDKIGGLSGSLGGTGTINYISGAYTVSNAGVGTANYLWEDSNSNGITDFRYSATRVAGEGFYISQDEGGDPILNVVIGSNGYYSMKASSSYLMSIGSTDTTLTNNIYRKQIGVLSYRGTLSTSQGIVFVNTHNPEKPEMTILQPNIASDALVPKILFPQFKFANYLFDDCTIDTYERYIIVACKTLTATNNDTLLLCDLTGDTVDITNYAGRVFTSSDGLLYVGSSIVQSTYQLFSGFDDDGFSLENQWTGKGETYSTGKNSAVGQALKKYRKIRLKGAISANQSYGVYVSYDDAGYQLVGSVIGSGSYVDYASPQTIGSNFIGEAQIGGDVGIDVYNYFVELRMKKVPKFRKRNVKFIANGIGYCSVNYEADIDVTQYEQKIPSRFRQKQNVSLQGDETDMNNPEF